jgi:hyperosmotically inducible periplasmic protein
MLKPPPIYTLVLAAGLAIAADQAAADRFMPALAQADVDNTEHNARDSSGATLTPDDQEEGAGDRKLSAAVRRAIVDNDSLSVNAHNVKIIAHEGTVTLRGPVESAAEKAKLQTIAGKVRGVKQVNNQLEPKTP